MKSALQEQVGFMGRTKDRDRIQSNDLIADIMSVLSPIVFCAALIALIDPLGCCQSPGTAEMVNLDHEERIQTPPDDVRPCDGIPVVRPG